MVRKQRWFSKMEQRWGRFAIHHLMYWIVALYILGAVLMINSPGIYERYFSLNAEMILHELQLWRLVTFLIQPPSTDFLFLIFALYLYYMIGTQLENRMGAFWFNLYFFSGVVLHVLAAFLVYLATGLSYSLGTEFLNLSLFFAFAMIFPDMEFLLFFVLPVKVKYLALLSGLFFLYNIFAPFFLRGSGSAMAGSIAAVVSLLNFVLFFQGEFRRSIFPFKQRMRKQKAKRDIPRGQAKMGHIYSGGARHCCAQCGKTELDDPALEFRYCSKCQGEKEYCQEHLYTHVHQ